MAARQRASEVQADIRSDRQYQPAAGAGEIIQASNLGYAYRETVALRDVSFTLPVGETLAVVGPSGCGKTTLLSLIAGLLMPASGGLLVAGEPARPRRPGTALIMQDYGLLPWKTVRQNAALGLQIRGLPTERADQALAEVGLADLGNRWPHQLSGGQRQRVAIARSLALEPDLLLMDEPFSALDALTREEMQDLLLALWRRHGTSMVLVTHSIAEAAYLAQQVIVISPRPGRIIGQFRNEAVGDRRGAAYHVLVNAVRDGLERGVTAGG